MLNDFIFRLYKTITLDDFLKINIDYDLVYFILLQGQNIEIYYLFQRITIVKS